MPMQARQGDMHTCPAVGPGGCPHVGGPINEGEGTVLVMGMPAAVLGNLCTCCCAPDSIAAGSGTVQIGGMPAARVGDATAHGGQISVGAPTVFTGG
jgi:uncharacterized Zn-binding protein involved in type VI secretion